MSIYIFGASEVGKKVYKILKKRGETVLGFIDNDKKKWNQEIYGLKIYKPSYLKKVNFDKVAIASFKGSDTIRAELIELGVLENNIIEPIKPNKIFYNGTIKNFDEANIFFPEKDISVLLYIYIEIELEYNFRFENMKKIIETCIDKNKLIIVENKLKKYLQENMYFNSNYQKMEFAKNIIEVFKTDSSIVIDMENVFSLLTTLEEKIFFLNTYLLIYPESMVGISLGNKQKAKSNLSLFDLKINYDDNYIGLISSLRSIFNKFNKNYYLINQEESLIWNLENFELTINIYKKSFIGEEKYTIKGKKEINNFRKNFLNNSTFEFLRYKLPIFEGERFFYMLDEMKEKLKNLNIGIDEACVVSGGVLQAYGLREGSDIDIILTEGLRDVYGNGLLIVSQNVEVHEKDEMEIKDTKIILESNNHFYFYGVKFANIDILYRYRKLKNNWDFKLIEGYKKLFK